MNREKKQLLVVGVLALMIVCVGAFQFMGGSSAPAPVAANSDGDAKKAAEEAKKKEEDEKLVKNPDFAVPLNRRDPFQKASFALKPVEPKPVVTPVTNTPDTKIRVPGRGKPFVIPGRPVPKFDELGGNDSGVGPMAVPEPRFNYSLSGIIAGTTPGAVFTDSSGNQKLVEVGQGIDGDATLLSVSRDKVRVKFHAKTLVLTVGGNPSAK